MTMMHTGYFISYYLNFTFIESKNKLLLELFAK